MTLWRKFLYWLRDRIDAALGEVDEIPDGYGEWTDMSDKTFKVVLTRTADSAS